jgi:hypothetical protein
MCSSEATQDPDIILTFSQPVSYTVSAGLTTVTSKGIAGGGEELQSSANPLTEGFLNSEGSFEGTNPGYNVSPFSGTLSGIGTYVLSESTQVGNNFTDGSGMPLTGTGFFQITFTALPEPLVPAATIATILFIFRRPAKFSSPPAATP